MITREQSRKIWRGAVDRVESRKNNFEERKGKEIKATFDGITKTHVNVVILVSRYEPRAAAAVP